MEVKIIIDDFYTVANRHLPKGTIRTVSREKGKQMIADKIATDPSIPELKEYKAEQKKRKTAPTEE